jgi:hypothetical protein
VKPGKSAKARKATTARKAPKADKGKPAKVAKPGKRPVSDEPVGRVVIRELDPQQKCGEGTSVQFLYRVDHTVDGHRTAHLVFFDPHGWYCEHGRTCPAVAHAKKHNGQFARVS